MEESAAKALGKRIKAIRVARGLTQAQLGELTKYEPMTISRFETANYAPGLDALEVLARALNVELSAFFQFDTPPISVAELRHRICDEIYNTDDPKTLTAMLKAVRKIKS